MIHDQDEDYNAGYTFEVFHAADIACDLWDNRVANTRCVHQYPEIKEAVELAGAAMGLVFNLIAQKLEQDGLMIIDRGEDVTKQ